MKSWSSKIHPGVQKLLICTEDQDMDPDLADLEQDLDPWVFPIHRVWNFEWFTFWQFKNLPSGSKVILNWFWWSRPGRSGSGGSRPNFGSISLSKGQGLNFWVIYFFKSLKICLVVQKSSSIGSKDPDLVDLDLTDRDHEWVQWMGFERGTPMIRAELI